MIPILPLKAVTTHHTPLCDFVLVTIFNHKNVITTRISILDGVTAVVVIIVD